MISRASSKRARFSATGIRKPWNWVGIDPRPTPNSRRPLERMSAIAACSAQWSGWWSGSSVTAVPIRIRCVRCAIAGTAMSGFDSRENAPPKWISASQATSKPSNSPNAIVSSISAYRSACARPGDSGAWKNRPNRMACKHTQKAASPPRPRGGGAYCLGPRLAVASTTMDFGIFLEQTRRGADQVQAFQDMFDLSDAAEAWGLDIVWLAEMLVNPARSVLSAPLLVGSWIVGRTKRLRVGTAVQLLPLNHPLRVAGEVTTLDHLGHGRFDFGIGRSGGTRSYDALGVPYQESQARFFEALEIILEAWKGEPFSYDGRFYRFTNVTVSPRPFQRPHPPVRMAATTPETFPRVGRMGLPIFVGLRGMDIPALTACLGEYRRAAQDA